MNINTLGLLNLMSHIINEEYNTSDYVITKYLLENIRDLETITVNEIIDNAHVSISSVRRYSKRLGFDNFSDFKKYFSDIAFPSNIHLREFYDFNEYKLLLDDGLKRMQEELHEVITDEIIQSLSQDIYDHENVFILCANNTTGNMVKFQQELMYVEKIVKIVSSNFAENLIPKVSEDDNLFIVVSISGVFTDSIMDYINQVEGKKILVTANRKASYTEFYDEIIYMSKRDVVEDKLGLLGKYGVTHFFDYVSQYYIYQYR